MNEIICPHCHKAFKVDEAGFADIVKQVRDSEFARELRERSELAERDKLAAVKLAEATITNELQTAITKHEAEIAQFKHDFTARTAALRAEKELVVSRLESSKASEIAALKVKLEAVATENKLAVTEAVRRIERDRDQLASQLQSKDAESKAVEMHLKERYEIQLKDRDDAIERLKDMKAKLSVKLIGENLEQHCHNEFNAVRATMFPFAYFDKDNQAIKDDDEQKGTKGDFVYRDYDAPGGIEIISIMFEMKDEQDVSINKRTVESHLEKLDKDRRKKGLEYAVLVTLLEAENELYNRGIVDVSYKYEKMYVVRPQFFLPLISLLKSANLKAVEAKRQLMIAQSQNIDITTFEDDMNDWKSSWLRIMKNAGSKHVEGVEQITKAIKDLEKAREALMLSDKHLLTAENKMDDLTIKRLTRKNPTMRTKFEALKPDSP